MKVMTKYELKKVFSRTGSKIALCILMITVGVSCYFACHISYVNEAGETEHGFSAVASLRKSQKEWTGILNEAKITKVIAENRRITGSPEYSSKNLIERGIAYSWGEGIKEIRQLLNYSFASGFREYNYYQANDLTEDAAGQFYSNRIALLKEWLREEASDQFSESEKSYLVRQYEDLETPFYYDYVQGWTQLFEFAPMVLMITTLVLGYLVAEIFSCEFSWKSDSVFFSSFYGRNKATAAKIKAGVCIVSGIYFIVMLLYTGIVLMYLGIDGWSCPIQIIKWKSFYNITLWQGYLLLLFGGYIGCLFMALLSMLSSAKTKSSVISVTIPFVLIFIPSFISNINSPSINKIIGLLPDQLLQTSTALNYFNLYSFGQKVIGAVPILLVLYTVLSIVLVPVMYQVYCHKQIN